MFLVSALYLEQSTPPTVFNEIFDTREECLINALSTVKELFYKALQNNDYGQHWVCSCKETRQRLSC
jgi:hypothetical protein